MTLIRPISPIWVGMTDFVRYKYKLALIIDT
ncbi:hypothetical protein SAMN05421813_104192 [Daejeonella rubra]|uniref:Uncharacterized protein n=1 Tax=Daejeonella rubra TaxID=990371 RepID=A0A1G9PM17_9SPHI|nr:hypothetical protein SAMN05421813_104192 [Daejeonella rubra]